MQILRVLDEHYVNSCFIDCQSQSLFLQVNIWFQVSSLLLYPKYLETTKYNPPKTPKKQKQFNMF